VSEVAGPDHGPATRVEFHYQDGTVRWLEGEAAQKFMENLDSTSVNAWVHGARFEPLPWQEKGPDS